jgi:hypothetical protein
MVTSPPEAGAELLDEGELDADAPDGACAAVPLCAGGGGGWRRMARCLGGGRPGPGHAGDGQGGQQHAPAQERGAGGRSAEAADHLDAAPVERPQHAGHARHLNIGDRGHRHQPDQRVAIVLGAPGPQPRQGRGVAGQLLGVQELAVGHPDQRVEPVQRPQAAGRPLDGDVSVVVVR